MKKLACSLTSRSWANRPAYCFIGARGTYLVVKVDLAVSLEFGGTHHIAGITLKDRADVDFCADAVFHASVVSGAVMVSVSNAGAYMLRTVKRVAKACRCVVRDPTHARRRSRLSTSGRNHANLRGATPVSAFRVCIRAGGVVKVSKGERITNERKKGEGEKEDGKLPSEEAEGMLLAKNSLRARS
jgi:hypothetical protein